MPKRLVFSMIALFSGLTFIANLGAPKRFAQGGRGCGEQQEKWNNVPPRKSAYAGKKSGPAPRRDISGIWDAIGFDGGLQVNGAHEHPALLPQKGGGPKEGLSQERASTGDGPTRWVLYILCLTRLWAWRHSRPISPRGRESDRCLPRWPTIPGSV